MGLDDKGQTLEDTELFFPDRRGLLKILGVSGVSVLSGCIGGSNSSDTYRSNGDGRNVEGSYIVGSPTDAESLNFLRVSDQSSSNRIGLTLDGAYAITTEQEVFPLWADIDTDDDRVYTVSLRDTLKWGGGYGDMTAEDWIHMIKEVFQAEDNWAGYSQQGYWRRNGDWIPVEKTGRLSFEIRLPNVDPSFPLRPIMWGQYCMPKEIIQRYRPKNDIEGLQRDQEIQTLAYSGNLGPYSFEEWSREAEFVASRNTDYYLRETDGLSDKWSDAPYFEEGIYKVIPEQSTRLLSLRNDEITTCEIPETKIQQFQSLDNIYVNIAPQPFITLLIYNMRSNSNFYEAFRKKEVRRALGYLIDKKTIVDNILRGYASIAHTFQPKWSRWYSDEKVEQFGVDENLGIEKAKSNLSKALQDTKYRFNGDKIIDGNGEQVVLKHVYAISQETTETMAEFISQRYEDLGFKVEISGVKFDTLLRKYAQNSWQGENSPPWSRGTYNGGPRDKSLSQESWDLMSGIIYNTYPRTPSSIRGFFIEKGGINYYGYKPDTDFNSLFNRASTETDEQKRRDIFSNIFGEISKEQPFNFLNLGVSVTGYKEELEGPREEFGYGWDNNTWYFR